MSLLYFVTSLVVAINAFVWLPTLPHLWYEAERVLYYPFQPYFDLAFSLLGRRSIPYEAYALITRAPFLLGPWMIIGLAVRKFRFR